LLEDKDIVQVLKNTLPDTLFNIKVSECKITLNFNGQSKQFWLDDWKKKKDIIIAIIASNLGNNKTIFARKCEVRKVEKADAEKFLNQNHLFGYLNAYYKYALFYKNEMVAIATFSKGRKMNRLNAEKRSFELISFCCKKHFSITGGLSKLLKAFINQLQPGDIMTYVDKDWSHGKAYLKLGFKLHSETPSQAFVYNTKLVTKYKIAHETYFENIKEVNIILVKNSGNLKLVYTPILS